MLRWWSCRVTRASLLWCPCASPLSVSHVISKGFPCRRWSSKSSSRLGSASTFQVNESLHVFLARPLPTGQFTIDWPVSCRGWTIALCGAMKCLAKAIRCWWMRIVVSIAYVSIFFGIIINIVWISAFICCLRRCIGCLQLLTTVQGEDHRRSLQGTQLHQQWASGSRGGMHEEGQYKKKKKLYWFFFLLSLICQDRMF